MASNDPTQATMTDQMTVQGQLKTVMDPNNPLMQQAQTQGMQIAADRGIVNSSMAQTGAQDAMYRAATPIAAADASTVARNAESNAQNATSIKGANISADASRYGADKSAAASMYGADKSSAASMYGADKSAATAITTNAATNAANLTANAENNKTSIANTTANNATSVANTTANNIANKQIADDKNANSVLIANNQIIATTADKTMNLIAAIDADPAIVDKTEATNHVLTISGLTYDAIKNGGVPDIRTIVVGSETPTGDIADENADGKPYRGNGYRPYGPGNWG